jgi:VWFA-related protein
MEIQTVSNNSITNCLSRGLLLRAVTIVFAFCLSFSALAQSGRRGTDSQKKSGEKADVRIETREVRLPVRAYDTHGKPVNDLTPRDVVIIENGEARQTTSIKLEPANVLLILDLSNEIGSFKNGESARNAIFSDDVDYDKEIGGDMVRRKSKPLIEQPAARDFAFRFINQLAPSDRIAVIQYSDKVQLLQDWTLDHKQAVDSIASRLRFGLQSHYYDALLLASQKMAECSSGRRVIVMVSDGLDSASKTTQAKATNAILKADTSVFIVSWTDLLRTEIGRAVKYSVAHEENNVPNYKRQKELERFVRSLDAPEEELKRLAEVSGGEFYLPSRFKLFFEQPDLIVKDLGAQYTLTYVTEREFADLDYHNVQVLGARAGITVRSRQRRYSE